ncbi:MAG TPA: XRE family transcriptional regulator [Burkholderiales bacterium]
MAKKFSDLRKKMSPAARAKAAARARVLAKDLPLYELRQARQLSQEQLASTLRVKQASISKLERRADMYLSTLRSYIEALGGDLEIVARFPDGAVRIKQLEDIEENKRGRVA